MGSWMGLVKQNAGEFILSGGFETVENSRNRTCNVCVRRERVLRSLNMQSPLHREITLLMTKIRRLASTSVNKRLSLVGSSMHEYRVLFRLAHDERVPQHELAFDAAMDRAAASRLLRDMTQAGLVTAEI